MGYTHQCYLRELAPECVLPCLYPDFGLIDAGVDVDLDADLWVDADATPTPILTPYALRTLQCCADVNVALMCTPSRRFLLQQMLSAGTAGPPSDPAGDAYDEEAAWKMKIVDVNRVSKGVKAGSMLRYSALIVVGNANVSACAATSAAVQLLAGKSHSAPRECGGLPAEGGGRSIQGSASRMGKFRHAKLSCDRFEGT